MRVDGLLIESFDRIHGIVHRVVDGLTASQLAYRPTADANSIAWLVWHLTRIQDDHVAELAGCEQRWIARGWYGKLRVPFDQVATGYGHTSEEVAAVLPRSGDLLTGYYDDVHSQTVRYLSVIDPASLDRVIDRSWDPPVTAGVRLVSVISDCLQHAGQAAYVRGLLA